MKPYEIEFTKKFIRKYKKLTTNNHELKQAVQQVLDKLIENPKDVKLGTHKVSTSQFGLVFSSTVTKDTRIIWEFSNNKIVIVVLDIGGHSGKRGVYK